jgi:cytochrome P450
MLLRSDHPSGMPPGPSAPLAVQAWRFLLDEVRLLERSRDRYGDIFTLRIPVLDPLVIVSDPAEVKRIFTGDPTQLHAGEGNEVLRPVVGDNSVLLLDEKPHLHQRKLMLPPFHGERMRLYGEAMREIAEEEIAGWREGEPFPVHPSMQRITLRVILRVVFGIEDRDQLAEFEQLVTAPLDRGQLLVMMPRLQKDFGRWSPWGRVVEARNRTQRAILDEIARRRADPRTAERDDILSMLLGARDEDGRPMSDQELHDELVTLLVAGHETTATALAWTFERLSRHPLELERLNRELAEGEEGYLDAVIKETLRVRPVLNFAMRKLTRPMEVGPYTVPAGATLASCIHLIHRRPDIYPEPEAFRPERFTNGGAPDTYSWLPFGGGIRRCLGASFATYEMKVVLRTVLERRELATTTAPGERRKRRAITFVPGRGGRIVVRPSAGSE